MDYTSIKVGQLPTGEISGGNFIPHEVAGVLKKATFTDLAAFIGASDAVGFRAVSVQNGGTLPTTDTQEFILVGPGTYNNVGGGSTITVTEELNALVSNGTYWFVGVEIPIDAPPGNAIWGQIIGTLSNQTDLKNILDLKADLVDGKVPASQLPSYVDDIIEVANYAALPATGETGKIYLTLDNNKIYRWSGSIYIEIAAENAVWGQIVGTLSNQTDLQSALNAKVPYTGATANVDLGTHTLSSYNLVVNHASGSGVAAQITKGGNGEALTVVKSSGTGNAASITGGKTLISELNLTTSLADAYIASAAIWNAKQNALNGTGFVKISGTTISYDNNDYISGTGTTNFLPKFTSSGVIGNSQIFDNGSFVGIGVSSGLNRILQVVGTTPISHKHTSSPLEMIIGQFDGSGNSVINNTANADLYFHTNNTRAISIKPTARVGIGTSFPSARFQVTETGGSGSNTNCALFSDSVSNTLGISNANGLNTVFSQSLASTPLASDLAFATTTNAINGTPIERMRITSGGNVGIGTTSPSAKLSLYDTSDVYLNISRGSSFINLGVDATGTFYNTSSIHRFLTASGSTEAMRITSGGNVGIGTTSPSNKLSIEGSTARIDINDGGGASKKAILIEPLGYGGNSYARIESYNYGTSTGGILALNATGGNVGIGTSNADARLRVSGTYNGTQAIFANVDGRGLEIATSLTAGTNEAGSVLNARGAGSGTMIFQTEGSERMRITSGGRVLIGTTSGVGEDFTSIFFNSGSTYSQAINIKDTNASASGTAYIVFRKSDDGGIGSITRIGTTSAVSYNTTSDYRLKEDFKPINGLDLVSKIKVYDFKWKDNDARMDGVIAHELQEVIPYAVTGEKDAEQMQSVDYSKLVPILVQAIQELKTEIEILKTK